MMDRFTIQIGEYLSSYRFYHDLLPQLHNYARQRSGAPITFDFTGTKSVSPLVIPNLLCVGYIIGRNYEHSPEIFVPDNSASDPVRTYLHDIDFVKVAKNYGLFSFTSSIDYGSRQRMIGSLNKTREFNFHEFATEIKDENGEEDIKVDKVGIERRVGCLFGDFFSKYLSDFEREYLTDEDRQATKERCNDAEEQCKELIINSIGHGESFAFMTAQVNYTQGRIFLSVADCGVGFRKAINKQIAKKKEPFQEYTKPMENELEAIVNAIFSRADDENKIYGLYPLIKKVLSLEGIVRIHSVDTQLILAPRMLVRLNVASSQGRNIQEIRDSFLNLVRREKSSDTVYTNMKCGGSHVEIELPLKREACDVQI